jgi:hypothetical protein
MSSLHGSSLLAIGQFCLTCGLVVSPRFVLVKLLKQKRCTMPDFTTPTGV